MRIESILAKHIGPCWFRVLAMGMFALLYSSGEPVKSGVKLLLQSLLDMWISDTGLLICTRRKIIILVLTPHRVVIRIKKYI